MRRHNLERDRAVHHRMLCPKYDAHASLAKAIEEFVPPEEESISSRKQLSCLPCGNQPLGNQLLRDP